MSSYLLGVFQLATLAEYFWSGRPYKVILNLLATQGFRRRYYDCSFTYDRADLYLCHCSMSWLKRKFRKLGLKKRCPDPTDDNIRALIEVADLLILICSGDLFSSSITDAHGFT